MIPPFLWHTSPFYGGGFFLCGCGSGSPTEVYTLFWAKTNNYMIYIYTVYVQFNTIPLLKLVLTLSPSRFFFVLLTWYSTHNFFRSFASVLNKKKVSPLATEEKLNYFMPGLAGPEYIDVWKLRKLQFKAWILWCFRVFLSHLQIIKHKPLVWWLYGPWRICGSML